DRPDREHSDDEGPQGVTCRVRMTIESVEDQHRTHEQQRERRDDSHKSKGAHASPSSYPLVGNVLVGIIVEPCSSPLPRWTAPLSCHVVRGDCRKETFCHSCWCTTSTICPNCSMRSSVSGPSMTIICVPPSWPKRARRQAMAAGAPQIARVASPCSPAKRSCTSVPRVHSTLVASRPTRAPACW